MNSTSQILVKMRRERVAQVRKEIWLEEARIAELRETLTKAERSLQNMKEHYAYLMEDFILDK